MANIKSIRLKRGRDYSLKRQHPWVFSGAIERWSAKPVEGEVVRVLSADGNFLCTGHYFSGSLALKAISFQDMMIDRAFWRQAVERAYDYRVQLGLATSPQTTAFRLINAEGDGLPGLVVDLYNTTAVVQFHSIGMYRHRVEIAESIREVLQDRITAIYYRSTTGTVEAESEEESDRGYLFGERGSSEILENGMRFEIDWETGQKTGFFLDQRENRQHVREAACGRKVLNTFCYTGGFSIAALKGGASHVTSIDASKPALELLHKNFELNFETVPEHEALASDCFQYLSTTDPTTYDMVILDPPAFAKHRNALERARKAYEEINYLGMKRTAPSGILCTYSCSQLLSREEFTGIVVEAAARARRSVRLIREFSQAPCHVTSLFHPEGVYLKGLMLVVE